MGEAAVLRVGEVVEHLPGDEHGHDDGVSAHSCQFRSATDEGIILGGGRTLLSGWGGLYKKDERFSRFALTEEVLALPVWIVPVIQELPCNR